MVSSVLHPRLDWHLDNWTIYIFAGGSRMLRCKTQSLWASGGTDIEKMTAYEVDLKSAMAVDALVWDQYENRDSSGRIRINPLGLTPIELAAVLHKHIDAVWRANRESLDIYYAEARRKISAGLIKRGLP